MERKKNKHIKENKDIEKLALPQGKKIPLRLTPPRLMLLRPISPERSLNEERQNDPNKRDFSKVMYYNCDKKGHYAKYFIEPKD